MYDLGCMLMVNRDPSWYSTDYRIYMGLKYDSATTSGLPLYLCSYKLVGSATVMILANQIEWIGMNDDIVSIFF